MFNPKQLLRERMKAERREAAKARSDAANHAARNFIASIPLNDASTVSLYYPIGDELDTEPLAAALLERDLKIALPVVVKKNQPLAFRAYSPGDALIDGAYGELVPDESAAVVAPQIIIAPLLAFTRDGGRLGYGGGYYDRTLLAARDAGPVLAVGYAFGAQEVDDLPLSPLDQPLDWVVTERGANRC